MNSPAKLEAAYAEYADRQAKRSRPNGTFYPGREYPNDRYELHETQPCCEGVKTLHRHAKTATHVAHLHGLDPKTFSVYCMERRRMETMEKRWKR